MVFQKCYFGRSIAISKSHDERKIQVVINVKNSHLKKVVMNKDDNLIRIQNICKVDFI